MMQAQPLARSEFKQGEWSKTLGRGFQVSV